VNLSEPPRECDVAVIGAGIVGLATARELAIRHPGLRIAVLEREPTIAPHQTGHTSGVIHAGIAYRPGSLKARLCTTGASELYAYCVERGIPTKRSGKLIVAVREEELARLGELERRGRENGVTGLRMLERAEIAELEPHARGVAALHSPATGVVDFARVAGAFADDLAGHGASVSLGCDVARVREQGGVASIEHSGGITRARALAVCAGAWADRLAIAAGAPAEPRIVPFRGAYLRLRPERAHLVRASIYPVADPELPFLGPHLTRGIDGRVLLGPSALLVGARDAYRATTVRGSDLRATLSWPGTWRLARRHWRTGAVELRHALSRGAFVAAARRLVPELRPSDFLTGPSGIRAQALGRDGSLVDDFVVSSTERSLFVRNAPSPAATSSLPLARLIADEIQPLL